MEPGADPELRFRAGLDHLRAGRPQDAIDDFRAVIAAAPDHAGAHATLGSTLLGLGQTAEAEASLRRAFALQPAHPTIFWNLGLLLLEQERAAEALKVADRALAARPGLARGHMLRGDALAALERFDEALPDYAAAEADPGEAGAALAKAGLALAALRRTDEAIAAFDRAQQLSPDDPFIPYRRGIARLQARDFGGWGDYEARWRLKPFLAKSAGVVSPALAPRLTLAPTAADLAGQRVLLLGEQGIGDQVMFASLIPDLTAIAASVTCVCDPRLVRLFTASFPGVAFAGPADARIDVAAIDRFVAMGSLAHAFRPDEASFPSTPYLRPSEAAQDRWRASLDEASGPRIGVSWRGGLPTTRRSARSLALESFAAPLRAAGRRLVSLQYGDFTAEAAAAGIEAFPKADIDDFDDLAALVCALDLVVSVQTSLVHLTGALGRPCLTLVPHHPEWRYTADGATMPWYGSVRIFRQPTPGNWPPVLAAVADAASARLSGAAPP